MASASLPSIGPPWPVPSTDAGEREISVTPDDERPRVRRRRRSDVPIVSETQPFDLEEEEVDAAADLAVDVRRR